MKSVFQRGPLLVFGLIAFALVLGSIVRLSIAHADTTSLIAFLTTVAVPGIPAIASWWTGKKTRKHAEDARNAAANAEANTNGKLDIKFADVQRTMKGISDQVTSIISKVDDHLVYHSDKDVPS